MDIARCTGGYGCRGGLADANVLHLPRATARSVPQTMRCYLPARWRDGTQAAPSRHYLTCALLRLGAGAGVRDLEPLPRAVPSSSLILLCRRTACLFFCSSST